MSKHIICVILVVSFALDVKLFAQELTLSLEECITLALENNLNLKSSECNLSRAENNFRQSKNSRHPNISFSSNYGYNFGFAVDPTTNNFADQTNDFLSGGLNLSIPIFTFGNINAQIRKANYDVLSSKANFEQSQRETSLNIANAFLNTALQKELVQNRTRNIELSRLQKDRIEKLFSAGAESEAELLNIKAQVAQDEQLLITQENALSQSLISLQFLCASATPIEPNLNDLSKLSIEDPYEALNFETLIETVKSTDPRLVAANMASLSAEEDINIAKTNRLPRLDAFGNMNSRYSSLSKYVVGFETKEQSSDLTINGQDVTVSQDVTSPIFEDAPLDHQLQNNFGQGLGISLQVPIYNQGLLQNQKKLAEIGKQQAELNTLLSHQEIENEVITAFQNYTNSKSSYIASNSAFEAQDLAYKNAENAFALGAINGFDQSQRRILKDNAESAMIQAKYNYLFNIKVLDFYLGKPIK